MGKIIKEFFERLFSTKSNYFWVGFFGTYPIHFLYFLHVQVIWSNVVLVILERVTASVFSAALSGLGAAFIADFYKHRCKHRVDKFLKPKIRKNEKDNDRAA